MWCSGSTHRTSLLQNVSRGQRVQLYEADVCLSVLVPLSQWRLWARRAGEAGSAVPLGERQPRDRDAAAESSCVLALPGGRCPWGGRERAGKPPAQQRGVCQAACHAGADGSPGPCVGAIWLCVVANPSAQLQRAALRKPVFRLPPWLCFLQELGLNVISPAPSFAAERCETSGHVIRSRNSSSPLLNRLRVMNPLKINAPYQQQNCCCGKRVTQSCWVWWVPLPWPLTCGAQPLAESKRFYPEWRREHKVTVQRRLPRKREGEPSSPKTKRELLIWSRLLPGLSQQTASDRGCPRRAQRLSMAKREMCCFGAAVMWRRQVTSRLAAFFPVWVQIQYLYLQAEDTLEQKTLHPIVLRGTLYTVIKPPSSHTNWNCLSGC